MSPTSSHFGQTRKPTPVIWGNLNGTQSVKVTLANTEKMIFILVYFQALKMNQFKYIYMQKWWRFSVFLFSSCIPTEKSQKIFLPSWKIFCERKLLHGLWWNVINGEITQNLFTIMENILQNKTFAWTLAKCYYRNKTGNPEQAVSLHLTCSDSQSVRDLVYLAHSRS